VVLVMIMCSLSTNGLFMRGRGGLLSTYAEHVEFVFRLQHRLHQQDSCGALCVRGNTPDLRHAEAVAVLPCRVCCGCRWLRTLVAAPTRSCWLT
jgi:hypothetical protein